ncbi:hypothetical protein CRE_06589 [Caenorhabditis remanei]|uniref:Peptidase M13 C-terminal domain-containing protein n=1 Tax=Caenorhabditis remanei TaxID=31234 RepID=E3M1N9_CAERE|nr:hypothetical protein CRE_06589 [Caenorhabditis remanei]
MVLNLESKPSKEKVPKPKKEAKPGKKLNPLKKEKPVKQKKIKAADPKKGGVVKPKDPKQGKVKTPNLFKKPKLLKKDEDVKVYNASPAPGQAARAPEPKNKKSYKSLLIHGVLVCIILALSLALLLVLLLSGKDKRNVCETPECISLSQQLLNWRDESVDPCKDFFQYSCGKYNEHVAVQGDSLDKHNRIVHGLMRGILESTGAYIGQSQIDFGLFTLQVASASHLVITGSRYKLPHPDVIKANFKEVYGYNPDENQLTEMVACNEEYIQLFLTISLELSEYSTLKDSIKSIGFDKIVKGTLKSRSKSWEKVEKMIMVDKNFVENAEDINNFIQQKKRQIANILFYKHFETSFRDLRSSPCHSMVAERLPLASNRMFVRNHLDKKNIEDAADLLENSRDVFIEMIEDSKWLDDKTKKNAIKKVKAMKAIVGYPKEFEKTGALDEIFADLDMNPNLSYHTMMRNIQEFRIHLVTSFGTSESTIDPTLYEFSTNAFYSSLGNSITISTNIIDDPLFHHSFPEYAKIAGVGFIINHEIGHGFDNGGRLFDENGNPKNWWTEKDVKEYEKRMMCLVEQYEKYDDPTFGKNLNGSLTLREMGADQISADVGWRSFKKIDLEEEQRLVGFEDYEIEKLYFQIGALNWCSPRPSHSLQMQLVDDHPVNNFRVNGVFANMKQFADTYDCPAGSPMNPKTKCEMF